MGSRMKPDTLLEMKGRNEPITMLTCYDYPTALRQEAAGVDVIFVGDSVGVNVLGYDRPQQVTMEDMIHHTRAVRRGVKEALLVSDMPFVSYNTPELAVSNARRFVEAGAEMVKVEGGREILDRVAAVLGDGIPVMGHVGFTPQTAGEGKHVVGAQARPSRTISARPRVISAARALSPNPRPSTIPQAIAKTFFTAPPISAPTTSSEE